MDWAYLTRTGSWARAFDAYGNIDEDKEWWIYCELDQVASALAINDPAYASYVVRTHQYWLQYMVDHEHHEIWHFVSGATNTPVAAFPKQHSWKNALHSFEHVLVCYFTAQQLHNLPTRLYYAFEATPPHVDINPYFYVGKLRSLTDVGDGTRCVQEALFTDVH